MTDKIEFIEMRNTASSEVQEYMIELNRQIERCFTVPYGMMLPPDAHREFMQRAWLMSEKIRQELFDLTVKHVLPIGFIPLHGKDKR